MAENSKIEWTDATWNPVLGCDKISPGCKNCYAIRTAHRLQGNPNPKVAKAFEGLTVVQGGQPNWTGRVNFVWDRLAEPLRWKQPQRIFVNSQSDLFHDGVNDMEIEAVFGVMALAQQHTFQILTKRPERMARWFKENNGPMETCEQGVQRHSEHTGKIRWDWRGNQAHLYHRATPESVANRRVWPGWPLPNVWLGVSCENQQTADERIPLLLQTPAAVRWISAEPLLGPIKLPPGYKGFRRMGDGLEYRWTQSFIDWLVAGGESGPKARPMHPDWARSLRDQCQAAGVPFFFKQWGEWAPFHFGNRRRSKRDLMMGSSGLTLDFPFIGNQLPPEGLIRMSRLGKKAAGRLLDGREWNEYPEAAR